MTVSAKPVLAALLLGAFSVPALAANPVQTVSPAPVYTSAGSLSYAGDASYNWKQPDLLSLGLGYEDFDKNDGSHKQSANFRGDYRWGVSLLPLISPWFKSWDPYVQFHPFAGVETNYWGSLWAGGGWATDFLIGRHGVVTWSEGVGFFEPGNMKSLHGNCEFRSQLEAGWIFTNQTRLTVYADHESDAGMTKSNPGEETVGIYYHIPIDILTGKKAF